MLLRNHYFDPPKLYGILNKACLIHYGFNHTILEGDK